MVIGGEYTGNKSIIKAQNNFLNLKKSLVFCGVMVHQFKIQVKKLTKINSITLKMVPCLNVT